MPTGYKCDRCAEFVSTGMLEREGPNGPPRRVVVQTTVSGRSQLRYEQNRYVLCSGCRDELVNWVEKYD